jgi:hypothetical protein
MRNASRGSRTARTSPASLARALVEYRLQQPKA